MLKSLSIHDFAIVSQAEIAYRPGFTAVTGETGAGKSILINALKLLLGAKAKTDLIRQGADKLRVEAAFALPPSPELRALLESLQLDADDDLVLERECTAAGKSRARVNGTLVALGDLEAIGRHLVDLHGQHEQQGLLDAGSHAAYLDGYGDSVAEALEYARRHAAWRASEAALKQAEEEAARLREQIEFLRFQFQELDKASPREGEEDALEAELKMFAGLEKVVAALQAGLDALEGQGGALPALGRVQRELQALQRHLDPGLLEGQPEKIAAAHDAASELRDKLRSLNIPAETDPARIDALNARLALLQRLRAKHKTDSAGLVALRERRRAEIARVENAGVETAALSESRAAALKAARAAASVLTEKRRAAARRFDAAVNARLHRLGMEGSRFETRFAPDAAEAGVDRVEFFLAANPGEPSRALRQCASGGEISRVMLGIKGALAQGDPRPVLVFDELDTGIGGATALRVGEALAELARHHQILAITHLHQVAAQAAQHHRVEKRLEGGRTAAHVLPLSEKERAAELARMMGDQSSETALRHARELLRKTSAS